MKLKNMKKVMAISLISSQIFSTSLSFASPDKIFTHSIVPKWDYHQRNFDEDGNVRIKPQTVLFDTENEVEEDINKDIPQINHIKELYSNDIKVEFDAVEYKNWQENIYKIVKEDTDTNNPNLESEINYKLEDGIITLFGDSRAIDDNKVYNIKVYSAGFDDVCFTIELLKEGSILIHPDFKPVEGLDLMFVLEDFNYAVKNPAYEVLLDGEVLEGNCKEYHIVSNIIRLENEALKKITVGKHELVVRAYGYKDFVKRFKVTKNDGTYILNYPHEEIDNLIEKEERVTRALENKAKNRVKRSMKVDALSSATSSSGGSNSSDPDVVSGASGSINQNINLVFDFDLLSNAKILEKLDMQTPHSSKIVELYNTSDKDFARKNDIDKSVSWIGYTNAYLDGQFDDKYISFEDYLNSPNAKLDPNKPYNVKYVLEDGLYGDVIAYNEVNKKETPSLTYDDVSKLNNNYEINIMDSEYLNSITKIKVNANILYKDEYKKQFGKIVIKNNRFTRGDNTITLYSNDYQNKEINVFMEAQDVKLYIDGKININEDVKILGASKDYIRNIEGLYLNGRGLFSDVAVTTDYDYKINSDIIILDKSLFADDSLKTLRIKSYGYMDKIIKLNNESDNQNNNQNNDENNNQNNGQNNDDDNSNNQNDDKNLLDPTGFKSEKIYQNDDIVIPLNKWANNINTIEINGVKLQEDSEYYKDISNAKFIIDSSNFAQIKDYNINIKSTDYKDYKISIKVSEALEVPKEVKIQNKDLSNLNGDLVVDLINVPFSFFDKNYKPYKVVVNNEELKHDEYDISTVFVTVDKTVFKINNDYEVRIQAKGYKDFVINFAYYDQDNNPNLLNPDGISNKDINQNDDVVLPLNKWANSINTIEIDGVKLQEGSGYYKDISNAKFIIDYSNFNEAKLYEITIKSNDYKAYNDVIMVKDALKVPNEVRIKNKNLNYLNGGLKVDLMNVPFSFFGKNYKPHKVIVNDRELNEDEYSISSVYVNINENVFEKNNDYEVRVLAKGYEDFVFNFSY